MRRHDAIDHEFSDARVWCRKKCRKNMSRMCSNTTGTQNRRGTTFAFESCDPRCDESTDQRHQAHGPYKLYWHAQTHIKVGTVGASGRDVRGDRHRRLGLADGGVNVGRRSRHELQQHSVKHRLRRRLGRLLRRLGGRRLSRSLLLLDLGGGSLDLAGLARRNRQALRRERGRHGQRRERELLWHGCGGR